MKSLHHAHHVIEDDDGLPLAQSLLLYDIMLQVNEVGRLVAEVVSTEAVQHQADSLLHLAHFVRLHVLHDLVGSILANNKTGVAGLGNLSVTFAAAELETR